MTYTSRFIAFFCVAASVLAKGQAPVSGEGYYISLTGDVNEGGTESRAHWDINTDNQRLAFAWDQSTDEMKSFVWSNNSFVGFTDGKKYSPTTVTPDVENKKQAQLQITTGLSQAYAEKDVIWAVSPLEDTNIGLDNKVTFTLPDGFTQTELNSTEHLKQYILMSGTGTVSAENTASISFDVLPAIYRFKVINTESEELTVNEVSISGPFCNKAELEYGKAPVYSVSNNGTYTIKVATLAGGLTVAANTTAYLYALVFPTETSSKSEEITLSFNGKYGDTPVEGYTKTAKCSDIYTYDLDSNTYYDMEVPVDKKAANDNEPDITGVESDAFALFKKIKVGWNLGNSLESYNEGLENHMDAETSWGNPKVEKWMIDAVKSAGFNTVRIPVRWYPHVTDQNTMAEISSDWLNRVKEVVDYCIDNDMYVILNTHHEDWLESHPLESEAETVLMKERNLWTAIATFFKDYDEHLIFSGTNEVEINWAAPSAENLRAQNNFNQCFVDAVRSTGGKNYYRNLIIQTYATNPDYAFSDYANGKLTFPTDVVENRIAIEFHYYRPAGFSYMDFADYAETVYYWGQDYIQYNNPGASNEQEDYVNWLFGKIKKEWVDKGYPVVMGEYGVVTPPKNKTEDYFNDLADTKKYYMKYITSAARKNGIVPIVWDNGKVYNPPYNPFEQGKEYFALFNRWYEMQVNLYSQPIIDGIMEGAQTEYPF